MVLLKSFLKTVQQTGLASRLAGRKVIVAVSGGADSLCLMHMLHSASDELAVTLHVATLDHGLRGAAGAADAEFVINAASSMGLTTTHEIADVEALAAAHKIGIEEAARLARYTFLTNVALTENASLIATGHNADDQAETILMHLIRGSGLGGLRGMRPITPIGQDHLLPGRALPREVTLVRPLLEISRADIDAYCTAHNLRPRQDATNLEGTYLRNKLRHEVLPLLESLNPQIRQVLARTGTVLADEFDLIEQAIDEEWRASQHTDTPGVAIDLVRFRRPELSDAVRRGLLRKALHETRPDQRNIGFIAIESALKTALEGSTSSEATLPGGVTMKVGYKALTFIAPNEDSFPMTSAPFMETGLVVDVALPGQTSLPDNPWTLHARWLEPSETASDFFDKPLTAVLTIGRDSHLQLRTRHDGDRFMPLGLGGKSQKLSDMLTNLKIPVGLRDRIPLLLVDGQIGWFTAGGLSRVNETFAVHSGQQAVLFQWQLAPLQ